MIERQPCDHPAHKGRHASAVPGTGLCPMHLAAALDRELADLARAHDDLAHALVERRTGADGRSQRGTSVGISLDPAATAAREHARLFLVGWCHVALEEGPWSIAPDDAVAAMATWLRARTAWLVQQPWIDELAGVLDETLRECRHAAQPDRPRRVEIGDCPARAVDGDTAQDTGPCNGRLFALIRPADSLLPSAIHCTSGHNHTWTPAQWQSLGRKVLLADTAKAHAATRRLLETLDSAKDA